MARAGFSGKGYGPFDRFLRERRAVGGDEQVFEHDKAPWKSGQWPPAPGSTTRVGLGASQMTEAATMKATPMAIIN